MRSETVAGVPSAPFLASGNIVSLMALKKNLKKTILRM